MKYLWIFLEKMGIISCAHDYSNWYIPMVNWVDLKSGRTFKGGDDYQYRDCKKCNHKDKKWV